MTPSSRRLTSGDAQALIAQGKAIESALDYHGRLQDIRQHLAAGGRVMVATYTKSTIYDSRHIARFTANKSGLYVTRGNKKECLNFTPIHFSA